MRNSFCALVSATLTGIASAWTTPSFADTGNSFYTPGLDQIVPAGAPFNVTWNPTTNGTVDLVLCHGPSSNCTDLVAISTNIPNTGSYLWYPSLSIQPDTSNYGIQLIVDATGAYQYTDQFGISNAGNPNVTTTSFLFSGTSTTSISVTATVASTIPSGSAIPIASANSSSIYTVPTMGMSNTVVIPTGSSSTQAAASPTASTAGVGRMVEGYGAVILGFGGILFVAL